jgi:hypothetical protein
MFEHFKRYPWVLELHRYTGVDDLVVDLPGRIVGPSEARAGLLAGRSPPD